MHRARNQHASQHGSQLLCETCASRGAPPTPPLRATMTSHTTTRSLTTWTRFSATRVANTSSLWTSKATTETRMEMDTTHTWTCHAGTQLPMREGNVGAHKAGSAPPPAHHLTQGRSASCLDGGSAHHRSGRNHSAQVIPRSCVGSAVGLTSDYTELSGGSGHG